MTLNQAAKPAVDSEVTKNGRHANIYFINIEVNEGGFTA